MAEAVLAGARRRPVAGIVLVMLTALVFGGGLTVAFMEARLSAERQAAQQRATAVAADIAAAQLVRDSLTALLEKERGRIARMDAELSDPAGFLK